MDKQKEPVTTDTDVERFNRWALTYDQSMMKRWFFGPVHGRIINLLLREGPKDPRCTIIDVGCGAGQLLRDISTQWPKAHVFVVYPAEEMLYGAKLNNPKAVFMLAPAEALPFPDQFADVVLSSISFHHWADPQRGVKEIARVLRPGGWFRLADHIFLPAKLFGDKVRSKTEIRSFMSNAGLAVRLHYKMGIRFVMITLAQKPLANS